MPAVVDDQTRPRGALSGQVAVVVGGASGIGRTVANALARQGARVVIADFDSERMERTVEEILELGIAEALALTTDVRSDASVRSMAGDAIKAMGQVDILVNMAGVLLEGPLDLRILVDEEGSALNIGEPVVVGGGPRPGVP